MNNLEIETFYSLISESVTSTKLYRDLSSAEWQILLDHSNYDVVRDPFGIITWQGLQVDVMGYIPEMNAMFINQSAHSKSEIELAVRILNRFAGYNVILLGTFSKSSNKVVHIDANGKRSLLTVLFLENRMNFVPADELSWQKTAWLKYARAEENASLLFKKIASICEDARKSIPLPHKTKPLLSQVLKGITGVFKVDCPVEPVDPQSYWKENVDQQLTEAKLLHALCRLLSDLEIPHYGISVHRGINGQRVSSHHALLKEQKTICFASTDEYGSKKKEYFSASADSEVVKATPVDSNEMQFFRVTDSLDVFRDVKGKHDVYSERMTFFQHDGKGPFLTWNEFEALGASHAEAKQRYLDAVSRSQTAFKKAA